MSTRVVECYHNTLVNSYIERLRVAEGITNNGPVVWGVAVCVRVGMSFCKVPVSGQDFRVTIKLSR